MRSDLQSQIGNAEDFLNAPKLLFYTTNTQKNAIRIPLKQIADRTRMNVRRSRPQFHMITANRASFWQHNVNCSNNKSSIGPILLSA